MTVRSVDGATDTVRQVFFDHRARHILAADLAA